MQAGLRRRSGPLFGAALVLVAMIGLVTPAVPTVAASDPSADPAATQSAAAADTPTPDPTQPTDTPTPTDSPTPAPEPTPTDTPAPAGSPAPSVTASPSDSPSPSESASPSDSPSPSDSALPSGSPAPSASATPSPSLAPKVIIGLQAFVDPNSPHVVTDTLSSDTCAICHRAHDASSANLLSTTYRIVPLRSANEPYSANDFALCWSCHSGTEAAIEDPTGATSGTNFPSHGFHLQSIGSSGSGGTDITVAGDGEGNALCAECHYNLHGTTASDRGLVVFAPDVQPYSGQPISYDPVSGNCTLTCHGAAHDGANGLVPASAASPTPSPTETPTPAPTDTPAPTPTTTDGSAPQPFLYRLA